jgi:hypothetical protein
MRHERKIYEIQRRDYRLHGSGSASQRHFASGNVLGLTIAGRIEKDATKVRR